MRGCLPGRGSADMKRCVRWCCCTRMATALHCECPDEYSRVEKGARTHWRAHWCFHGSGATIQSSGHACRVSHNKAISSDALISGAPDVRGCTVKDFQRSSAAFSEAQICCCIVPQPAQTSPHASDECAAAMHSEFAVAAHLHDGDVHVFGFVVARPVRAAAHGVVRMRPGHHWCGHIQRRRIVLPPDAARHNRLASEGCSPSFRQVAPPTLRTYNCQSDLISRRALPESQEAMHQHNSFGPWSAQQWPLVTSVP